MQSTVVSGPAYPIYAPHFGVQIFYCKDLVLIFHPNAVLLSAASSPLLGENWINQFSRSTASMIMILTDLRTARRVSSQRWDAFSECRYAY